MARSVLADADGQTARRCNLTNGKQFEFAAVVPDVTTANTYQPAAGQVKSAELATTLGPPAAGAFTAQLATEAPTVATVGVAPEAPPHVATGYRLKVKFTAGATAFAISDPCNRSLTVREFAKSAGSR
jgi:hypothetical protein